MRGFDTYTYQTCPACTSVEKNYSHDQSSHGNWARGGGGGGGGGGKGKGKGGGSKTALGDIVGSGKGKGGAKGGKGGGGGKGSGGKGGVYKIDGKFEEVASITEFEGLKGKPWMNIKTKSGRVVTRPKVEEFTSKDDGKKYESVMDNDGKITVRPKKT